MRLLLINLPNPHRLMRRYVASYDAPNFLIQPLELMSLGAVAAARPGTEVRLLDCIAEGLDIHATRDWVAAWDPDLVVSMTGFEVCGEDLDGLARLRSALRPEARIVVFGYLPTQRPEEVLRHGACDGVLLGEPELTLRALLACLAQSGRLEDVGGLASLSGDGALVVNPASGRSSDLDALPWADHGLLQRDRYRESFMPRPTGAIMSARGCSHPCTFCVRTFGRQLRFRSAASLAEEMLQLGREGIRHVRFLDDTFTLKRGRVAALCDRLDELRAAGEALPETWTALTRLDRLDPLLLSRMRRAGCRRLYVGIESGSQRVLDLYQKGLTLETIRERVPWIREVGIETCGFFIVGAPDETETELEASVRLSLELELDYIIVTRLQYWPGTALFEEHRQDLSFSLFPTRCEPLEGSGIMSRREYLRWERTFYRRFYLRPRYAARRLATLVRTPGDVVEGLGRFSAFVTELRRNRDVI